MRSKNYRKEHRRLYLFMMVVIVFNLVPSLKGNAQELPPRPIEVTVVASQYLNFGAFSITSSGGTVIIYPDGSRSSTGDIVLLSAGSIFSTALFQVEAYPGTTISVLQGSGTGGTITGDHGGEMTVTIGDSYPLSPFVISTTAATQVNVGGILTVGNTTVNPPGYYSGFIDVVFVQE